MMRRWVNSGKLRTCGVAGIVFANGFTPREIAATKLWYRSDVGVTQAANLVSNWAEQSGAGSTHDWIAAGGARPTYTASDALFGNRPSLTFDGVANFFSVVAQTVLAAGVTLFVAWKPDDTNAVRTFFSDLGDVGGTSILRQINNTFQLADEASNSTTTPSLTFSTTAAHVLGVDATNGAQRFWLDNATTATAAGAATWGTFDVTQFGTRAAGTFFKGRAAETVVCSGVLSASDRKRVMRYMGALYGIAIT